MDYEVIMVTLNFRLGALGFMTLEDDYMPGNFGLWDQKLALEWIQLNIQSFGGDPEKVSLFQLGITVSDHDRPLLMKWALLFWTAAATSSGPVLLYVTERITEVRLIRREVKPYIFFGRQCSKNFSRARRKIL